ncbi:MAG: DUF6036 family nucleotidyltransferase [Planctomycetota bacterium]
MPSSFRDLLASLKDEQIEALLVGGYAVAIHGYPRPTEDLDLWVNPDPSEASRLVRLLERSGFEVQLDWIMKLQSEFAVIRIGDPPFRIDLMTSCDGCNWKDAWSRRLTIEDDGVTIHVLSLTDLRAAKLAAGRLKDLADLEELPTPEDDPHDDA